jgi:hypothetical protein
MSDHEELIAQAKERAEERAGASAGHDDWGTRIELNDTGDRFVGRYRGEAEDENYDGHARRVHLAWDEDGEVVALDTFLRYAVPLVVVHVLQGAADRVGELEHRVDFLERLLFDSRPLTAA